MHLDSRDGATLSIVVGIGLLASPWYLERGAAAVVAPVVDPLGSIGLLPSAAFPAVIGTAYLTAGLLSLLFVGSEPLSYRPVVTAGLGAAVVALVTGASLAVGGSGPRLLDVAALTLLTATAIVPVAFVAGLDAETPGRRWPFALAALLFVPLCAVLAIRVDGDVVSLVDGALTVAAGVVVLAGILWGYPLYRLGRAFEVVDR